jgi:hypothetical protein
MEEKLTEFDYSSVKIVQAEEKREKEIYKEQKQ